MDVIEQFRCLHCACVMSSCHICQCTTANVGHTGCVCDTQLSRPLTVAALISADTVALLEGQRTCDSQLAGSSAGWPPLCDILGQATYTCVPLSPSSVTIKSSPVVFTELKENLAKLPTPVCLSPSNIICACQAG